MNPILAASAISAGGAVLSSLMNKGGRSLPSVNYAPLIEAIKANQATEQRAVESGYEELQPYLEEYTKKAGETTADYEKRIAKLKETYTTEAKRTEEAQGRLLSDQLKRKVLGSLPELQRSLRKQLASTGGLARGGARSAMTGTVQDAIRQLSEGETSLAIQQEQSRNALQQKLLGIDEAALNSVFGVTRADLQTALNTGRQDVQDKVQGIVDSLESMNAATASLTGQQISADYNKRLAEATARGKGTTDLTNALINAGVNVGTAWAYAPKTTTPPSAPPTAWRYTGQPLSTIGLTTQGFKL